MTNEKSTKRTITLTNHLPVRIADADWPVIGYASGDSWPAGVIDLARRQQAYEAGNLDAWWIRVRRNADGRTLVYGRLVAGRHSHLEDRAGGSLLESESDEDAVVRAVMQVAEHLAIPSETVDECIAGLPAVAI